MEDGTEELQMPSVEYTWIINDFSKQNERLDSKNFSPPSKPHNLNFYLSLLPTDKDIQLDIYYNLPHSNIKMELKCNTSIINANKKKCHMSEINSVVVWQNYKSSWGNPNYLASKLISRIDLLNPNMNYLTRDTCIINCDISYSINLTTTNESRKNCLNESFHNISESTVLSNYANLLMDNKFSDVILVVDKIEYRAHKFILSTQSPVFCAMFQHDTKENQECRVEITDVDPQVMKYLLDYIYAGKINIMDYCAIDLLAAADKYQISHLKKVCEKVLCFNLPENNLRKIARLADMHNCPKLRNKALAKIQKKTLEDIQSMGYNLEFLLNVSENVENNKLLKTNFDEQTIIISESD